MAYFFIQTSIIVDRDLWFSRIAPNSEQDAVVKIDANTGASRGFGFIIFANEASIDAVFASGSHEIDGKKVRLYCNIIFTENL